MFDVLIVGGGPAGIYAGIMSAMNKMSSCIVESMPFLGGQPIIFYPTKDIYDLPGFNSIMAGDFIDNLISQLDTFKNYKPSVFLESSLINFEKKENYYVSTLSNGKIIVSRSIIFASGLFSLSPKKLIIDSNCIENENIHYTFIKDDIYKDCQVIILGGGDSALDWASHLCEKNITNKITIIHRKKDFRARIDKINKIKNLKIFTLMNKNVVGITTNKLIIQDVSSLEKEELFFDKILVQYGFETVKNSTNNLLNKFEMDDNNICVSRSFETSSKNIYIVGQCANYLSKPNLIIVSMSEAAKAVFSILWKIKNGYFNETE
ncbi:MAG: NAD(P)/FAD-dependent oxidoreductase [Mycoplasmoidaceae bacterium]